MRYLITLTPLEPYFFGNNSTIENTKIKNGYYILNSNYFPQQTTFLGTLRKALIEAIKDYKKAREVVGGSKFFIKSKDDKKLDFGAINSISNLFIIKENEFFIPLRDIFSFKIQKEEEYFVKGYNYPKKIEVKLFNLEFTKSLRVPDVFKEIKILNSTKKENIFFKKTLIKMEEGFSFGYIVDYEGDLNMLNNRVVFFGGEKSKFLIQVTQKFNLNNYIPKLKEKISQVTTEKYIYLLNDSYININIKKHCDFAITLEVPFRYISHFNQRHYFKSKQFYFYEKGGLFLNYDENLKKALNKEYLQQVGYNLFIISEGKNDNNLFT